VVVPVRATRVGLSSQKKGNGIDVIPKRRVEQRRHPEVVPSVQIVAGRNRGAKGLCIRCKHRLENAATFPAPHQTHLTHQTYQTYLTGGSIARSAKPSAGDGAGCAWTEAGRVAGSRLRASRRRSPSM
jgi:hypothetical protein